MTVATTFPFRLFCVASILARAQYANGRLSTQRRRGRADDQPNLSMPSSSIEENAAESREVCIVGGGPAGTYAAHLLQKKGYTTALFDEASRLGGKTVPYDGDDTMFRHVLSNDMTLVNKFIKEFNLESYKKERGNINEMSDVDPFDIKAIRRENTFEDMMLGPTTGLSTEATSASIKYISIWNDYEPLIMQYNHKNVPEELMKPAIEWLADNGLTAMSEYSGFYNGLTNYGYSTIDKIPAIYMLMYVTPEKLKWTTSYMAGVYSPLSGEDDETPWFPMHLIFDKMGQNLNDVHTDTRVESLVQTSSQDGPWILHAKSLNDGQDVSYTCDKVILAFPPTEDGLGIINGLNETTKSIFTDNIQHIDYWEAIITNQPYCASRDYTSCLARNNMYFKAPAKTENMLGASHHIPNVYHMPEDKTWVLFNGGYQSFANEEEVFDNIFNHLEGAFGYEENSYDIEMYNKWQYFPHVSSDAMKNGFYDKVEEIQGKQNLYYTGGFRCFELVDSSMHTTEDLLEIHFPSRS